MDTASGRVLLAQVPELELDNLLAGVALRPLTPWTVAGHGELRATIARARKDEFCIVDQEVEQGLRSLAAPVRDSTGRAVMSVGASCHVSRASMERLSDRFAPAVLRTAGAIADELGSAAPRCWSATTALRDQARP